MGKRAGVIVADSDERNTVSISSSDSDNLTSDKDKKVKKGKRQERQEVEEGKAEKKEKK